MCRQRSIFGNLGTPACKSQTIVRYRGCCFLPRAIISCSAKLSATLSPTALLIPVISILMSKDTAVTVECVRQLLFGFSTSQATAQVTHKSSFEHRENSMSRNQAALAHETTRSSSSVPRESKSLDCLRERCATDWDRRRVDARRSADQADGRWGTLRLSAHEPGWPDP